MHSILHLLWKQTVWTLIRLLLREQSDLGPIVCNIDYPGTSAEDKADIICREGSGSVVECLTRHRRAVGSSLTGVTALCP